jgi:hypothetical protein
MGKFGCQPETSRKQPLLRLGPSNPLKRCATKKNPENLIAYLAIRKSASALTRPDFFLRQVRRAIDEFARGLDRRCGKSHVGHRMGESVPNAAYDLQIVPCILTHEVEIKGGTYFLIKASVFSPSVLSHGLPKPVDHLIPVWLQHHCDACRQSDFRERSTGQGGRAVIQLASHNPLDNSFHVPSGWLTYQIVQVLLPLLHVHPHEPLNFGPASRH